MINKIIIIGYGNIALKHKKILSQLIKNSNIIFFRITKNNNNKKNDKFFYEIKDILNFKPDLIVVANPASKHIEICQKLLILKSPFFIEKPISNNLLKAKNFIKKCNDNSVPLFIGYNLRFMQSLIEVKKILQKKILGSLNLVLVEAGYNLINWRVNKDYKKTVSAQKKLGGGVLLEFSHEIDYLIWLFGSIKEIDCFTNNYSSLKMDVEDFANLRVFFDKTTLSKNLLTIVNLDFFRQDKTRKFTIIGSKSTLKWDAINGSVKIFDKFKNKWITLYKDKKDLKKSYIKEWIFFLKIINNKNYKILNDGMDALKAINKIKHK